MARSPATEGAKGKKIASWSATLLWIGGFALAFLIPAGSPFIWVPDTLLLLGFWPLLFYYRPWWPWLLFGLCNMFIGFVLQVAQFLPDAEFPAKILPVKAHLVAMHVPMVWLSIGFISLAYGIIRIVMRLVKIKS